MTKTVVITGGSSGLGFAFARELGEKGYHVIILGRNKDRLFQAVQSLESLYIQVIGYVCDITNETSLKKTADLVRDEIGHIDFLILNAGEVSTSLLSDYPDTKTLKKDLEIDLWGTIQSTWFFLPLLPEGSRILMISSAFGMMGAAGYAVYCAAKAGVINFAESLRRELLNEGIQVYVACPGDMDTPQYRKEIGEQPAWMKTGSPRKVKPVEKIAQKILKKCHGKTKFLIIPSGEVNLLYLASCYLPRKWRDKLLDNMFPRPKRKILTETNHLKKINPS